MTVDIQKVMDELIESHVLAGPDIRITALSGGVSSDIQILDDGHRRVVVKTALDTLKVKELWRADVNRNIAEQNFIQQVATFLPHAVPRLLQCDPRRNFFVMDYLAGYHDWKSELLTGEADPVLARQAGEILGTIHRHTWSDQALSHRFDTTGNFHALRTDPYLLTTARRHPSLGGQIRAEAERLESTRLCLIHGDFSPKNIMVNRGNMVLLDCEVAWYGEPAFDLAFLFNHFLLKALLHRQHWDAFTELVNCAWQEYGSAFDLVDPDLEHRTGRLLLMLMLARVDGKSPVEYIADDTTRHIVRSFVYALLPQEAFGLEEICTRWGRHLSIHQDSN